MFQESSKKDGGKYQGLERQLLFKFIFNLCSHNVYFVLLTWILKIVFVHIWCLTYVWHTSSFQMARITSGAHYYWNLPHVCKYVCYLTDSSLLLTFWMLPVLSVLFAPNISETWFFYIFEIWQLRTVYSLALCSRIPQISSIMNSSHF
jgi:hypothetical protein